MIVLSTRMVKPRSAYWETLYECEGGVWILEGQRISRTYAESLIAKASKELNFELETFGKL